MGQGFNFKCKKCGYTTGGFFGVGFAYPSVYQETLKQAKNGELGVEIKEFLERHPDGAINAETVLLRCKKCGALRADKALDMYLPKEGVKKDNEFATPWMLDEDYILYKRYTHKCECCDGEMENLGNMNEPVSLKCPECGSMLETEGEIDWD